MTTIEMVATGLYEELTGSLDQGKWSCHLSDIGPNWWIVRAFRAVPCAMPLIQITLVGDYVVWCGIFEEYHRGSLTTKVTAQHTLDYNDPTSLDRLLAEAVDWLLAQ